MWIARKEGIMLLNVVLGFLVVVLAWSKFRPRNRARERERCKLIILHRIKSSGKTFGLELGYLCGKDIGGIYPYLRDMEREGLLETHESEEVFASRGGRSRIYYTLTRKGEEYIEESARSFMAGKIPNIFLLP